MKQKENIEEAKKILGTDRVYEAGRDSFSVPLFGRGQPNLTAVIPRKFMLDSEGKPVSPLESERLAARGYGSDASKDAAGKMVQGLNLWDERSWREKAYNNISLTAGRFRESRNGKPVFELCPATEATHLLVTDERNWYDGSPRSNGHTEKGDATYFHGNAGHEYWVVPTDWPGYSGEKPMPEALAEMQGWLDKREAGAEERYGEFLKRQAELAAKREAGGKLLEKEVPPLLKEIRGLDPGFVCRQDGDGYILLGTPAYGKDTKDSYDISRADDILASLKESLGWLTERREEKAAVENAGVDAAKFDIDQIHELAKGLKAGLSPEQVKAYADPGLTAWDYYEIDPGDARTWFPDRSRIPKTNQMEFLRESLLRGAPTENVKLCADKGLGRAAARELLEAMEKYGVSAEKLKKYPLKGASAGAMGPLVKLVADEAPERIKDYCFLHKSSGDKITAMAEGIKAGLTVDEVLVHDDPVLAEQNHYDPDKKTWSDFKHDDLSEYLRIQGLINERLESCGIRHQDFPASNLGSMACLLDAGVSPGTVAAVGKDEKKDFRFIASNIVRAVREGLPESLIPVLAKNSAYHIRNATDFMIEGLRSGLSEKALLFAADPKWQYEEAEAICGGFRAGMSFKDVETCANAGFGAEGMTRLLEGLRENDPWALSVAAGYPSYSRWHRETGHTDIGVAYVIRPDGTLREPDSGSRGSNDGTQTWYGLKPGEVALSATKEYTRAPLVVSVDWADRAPTKAQLGKAEEKIRGLIERFDMCAVPRGYKPDYDYDYDCGKISDIGGWLKDSLNEKASECRERLDPDYMERIEGLPGGQGTGPGEGAGANRDSQDEDEREL